MCRLKLKYRSAHRRTDNEISSLVRPDNGISSLVRAGNGIALLVRTDNGIASLVRADNGIASFVRTDNVFSVVRSSRPLSGMSSLKKTQVMKSQ